MKSRGIAIGNDSLIVGGVGGSGVGSNIGSDFDGSDHTTVVSASIFSFLYSEIVQYHQNRVDSVSDLERRLEATGYGVGLRILELLVYRNRDVCYVVFVAFVNCPFVSHLIILIFLYGDYYLLWSL
jgi:hypothetical protein